jgi:uncharacterized protein (TIGR00369 family)
MPEDDQLPLPDEFVAMLNDRRGGFNETLGLTFVTASRDEVVGELTIGPHLSQPYGIVHGGVYSSMIETLASVGSAVHAMADGKHTVGVENSTSFLRATRGGKLTGTAKPLVLGRRSHVWEVTITDETERAVAVGRVRMLIIEADVKLAGQKVNVEMT